METRTETIPYGIIPQGIMDRLKTDHLEGWEEYICPKCLKVVHYQPPRLKNRDGLCFACASPSISNTTKTGIFRDALCTYPGCKRRCTKQGIKHHITASHPVSPKDVKKYIRYIKNE